MLASLTWLEVHVPEGTLNAQTHTQAHFLHWKTPIGTPVMAEIISDLNDIRRHYWEA
jgi:hypothetical protein